MLTLNGICWCLLVSFGAWRRLFSVLWCLEMRGGCLRIYSKCLWVLFMDVIKFWVPLREYLSVQALYDAANALYWKISERQNSTHLAFFKHQNTKTSLYKLVRRELQFTVYLDHPVFVFLYLIGWFSNNTSFHSRNVNMLNNTPTLSLGVSIMCECVFQLNHKIRSAD